MLSILRQATVLVVLSIWSTVMAVVCATLMTGHWVPLPTPTIGTAQKFVAIAKLPDSKMTESATADQSGWTAYHFLYIECPCSQRVLQHLSKRSPHPKVEEVIVLIGDSQSNRQLSFNNGFVIDFVTPTELKSKYAVESAPLLVVLAPDKTARYSGGYTSRKQGYEIQDVDLISRALAGEEIQPLPLYGCGVSNELKALTDPLRVKAILVQ